MEKNGKSLHEITLKYETVIKKLGDKYRPAPPIEATD